MMDTKVNKGCTVISEPRHRAEASCQPPVGVHSRLMGFEEQREF